MHTVADHTDRAKRLRAEEAALPVMEAFYTIQGEGFHQGKAAYFIRLAGCDVGCVWCDVKESWDQSLHPSQPLAEIVEAAAVHPSRIAVVTGGEPLMHDLTALTQRLKKAGFKTHIETSGAHALSGAWDWICLSPKKFKKPKLEICQVAQELKVVVYNRHDLRWAEDNARLVGPDCTLFLQPEWSRKDEMMPLIVDYVKANPRWQISLQTHKYLDIP